MFGPGVTTQLCVGPQRPSRLQYGKVSAGLTPSAKPGHLMMQDGTEALWSGVWRSVGHGGGGEATAQLSLVLGRAAQMWWARGALPSGL